MKTHETDLTRIGLRAAVKTVMSEYYGTGSFKGVITDGLMFTTTTHYDTSGTWTEEISKYDHTGYKVTRKRKFDARGKILLESVRPGDHRGYDDKEYKYDLTGHLREIRDHGQAATDGPDKHKRYPFDFVTKYDTSGRCIQEEDLSGRKIYTYDANSNCIQYVSRVAGQKNDTVAFVYDERCRRTISYQTGSHPIKTIYTYDSLDSLVEINQVLGRGYRKTTYEYNADGDRITEKGVDADGRTLQNNSYKYLYDVKGNWLQKDIYADDQQKGYYIRKITYY